MIITDNVEGNQKNKPPTSTNRPETNNPPPAYGSEVIAPGPVAGPASPSVHPDEQRRPLLSPAQNYAPGAARGRFCRAFSVAVFIWLLLSLLVRSIVGVANWKRRHNPWTDDFPIPSGIWTSDCASQGTWKVVIREQGESFPPGSWFTYASRTQYDLPLSADTLFLLSRGSTSGTANIRISNSIPSDVVRVDVTVKYRNWDVRDIGTKVCRIHREDGSNGVGIFNRRPFVSDDFSYHTYFEIDAQIPASGHIRNFETDLPNSDQQVDHLSNQVDLASISLRSSNAPISIKSVSAKDIKIQTSNSPILGSVNASNSLQLKTTNGPILADTVLHNDGTGVSHLSLHTSNDKLDSTIALFSSQPKGGKYMIEATTTNGPLNLDFKDAPLDSEMRLLATSSNSPASVSLHPTYEGSLNLRTSSPMTPRVRDFEATDPSGQGRHRRVHTTVSKGSLTGSVSWSAKPGRGTVTVQTSNSGLTVNL